METSEHTQIHKTQHKLSTSSHEYILVARLWLPQLSHLLLRIVCEICTEEFFLFSRTSRCRVPSPQVFMIGTDPHPANAVKRALFHAQLSRDVRSKVSKHGEDGKIWTRVGPIWDCTVATLPGRRAVIVGLDNGSVGSLPYWAVLLAIWPSAPLALGFIYGKRQRGQKA